MLIAVFIISKTSFSQVQPDSLATDDDQVFAAIARYPADMRTAILDVAQYPKVLVKLEKVQARSSQAFQDLVEPLNRDEQAKLYQASRFPETVTKLVMAGKGHPARIQDIIRDFPNQIQQDLFDAYNKHYDELVRMDGIYQTSQGKLATLTDGYPQSLQEHFKKVLANPDVMTLLTDNINLTVSLGNSYQSDPQGITSQLDEINQKLTEQNGKDLLAYQEQVASDPALQNEMKSAADEYARQNNPSATNPDYVNNFYYNTPYPYWFGYPTWYGSPMWYPYPYFQTGYYSGASGIVITSLPSFGYSRWFYSHSYRKYPRLYSCYITYYYKPMVNIANSYRGMYANGRSYYNRRNSSYNYSNRTRSYSYGSSGRNSYTRSDSYRGSRYNNSGSRNNPSRYQSTLQQGVYYNQRYVPYHASTYYKPGYNPGSSRSFSGGSGIRGGYSGGSRSFGGSGLGGGSRSFSGGSHGRGR